MFESFPTSRERCPLCHDYLHRCKFLLTSKLKNSCSTNQSFSHAFYNKREFLHFEKHVCSCNHDAQHVLRAWAPWMCVGKYCGGTSLCLRCQPLVGGLVVLWWLNLFSLLIFLYLVDHCASWQGNVICWHRTDSKRCFFKHRSVQMLRDLSLSSDCRTTVVPAREQGGFCVHIVCKS